MVTLKNIIGIDALDMKVSHEDSVEEWNFSLLVLDPGKMVGWAGIVNGSRIAVGQAPWHDCLDLVAERVFIERTPFAAQRTFDTWPLYYTGAVIAKLYPREVNFVLPTNLKVAQKWYSLPRKHGLGPHAKDALTHLVHILVTER